MLQDTWFFGPQVAGAAVHRTVTTVDVHQRSAPLAVRGERVVGVHARGGWFGVRVGDAFRCARYFQAAVVLLTHEPDYGIA